jgi:dienelactone hydrolase
MVRCTLFALFLLTLLHQPDQRIAQDQPPHPDAIEMRECLILPGVGAGGRSPVHVDALEAMIVAGKFATPKAGDKVKGRNGDDKAWYKATAGEGGLFASEDYAGAYAFWSVESEKETTAILKAGGYSIAYVNGELHYGDPYSNGNVQVPVLLRKGANELLFLIGRGQFSASLTPRRNDTAFINPDDATLPDLVEGRTKGKHLGALTIVNPDALGILAQTSYMMPDGVHVRGREWYVPARSTTKIPFQFEVTEEHPVGALRVPIDLTYRIAGVTPRDVILAAGFQTMNLNVVRETDVRKVTFFSGIDGSVQYYGLRPAQPMPGSADKPGIVLSLHGAGVQASGQAAAYSPKSWCHIVCPTNRRPYGFDWEDWGRLDAMEVLAHAQSTLDNDPTKVWLTGHSMGGHGTWTIGSHFPDVFAAIAPSAGWESFWSYAGGGGHPEEFAVSELLTRAANPSRTLLRKYNYKSQGVYILHGDADDNVPVTEARKMRDALKEFHTDVGYFEQPGAGHWWDGGHDNGADCVDWAPMFDMFARRRLPQINEVMSVDFTTVCPEHSADCHWARIEMQDKQLAPSRVQINLAPNLGVFEGTTENVTRMSLQVDGVLAVRESLSVKLDGSEISITWPDSGRVYLRKIDAGWQVIEAPTASLKGPHRYGWFKNAFNHAFVYVYGTQGSEAADAATLDKARFDLEHWGYRANGSFDVIPDTDFDAKAYAGRNIILVGNADTNSAWAKLLAGCPVHVGNGVVRIGEREVKGDDLALLFTYPIAGSDNNSVAVIAGTGEKGTRLTNRLGYFTSGASFPDLILYGPDMLETGTGGVIATGYFGEDWTVKSGEFVWRDDKKK